MKKETVKAVSVWSFALAAFVNLGYLMMSDAPDPTVLVWMGWVLVGTAAFQYFATRRA